MIINTKEIQELIDSDITGYEIFKQAGISQGTISELRSGKRQLQNITLKVASDFQKYIDQQKEQEKERNSKMLVLKLDDQGDLQELGRFENVEQLQKYLIENTDDLFDWILENEPEKELPDFTDAITLREINQILNDFDYSWWTIWVEEE